MKYGTMLRVKIGYKTQFNNTKSFDEYSTGVSGQLSSDTTSLLNGGGTYGGCVHLSNAQFTPWKNGWCLMADAPIVDPNRLAGSLTSSWEIRSLAAAGTMGSLGNSRARATMLAKIPSVHQSTGLPWPSPDTISGAKYSWVPTKDMDRTSMGSATNSGPPRWPVFFLRLRFGWKHDTAGTIQFGIMHEEDVKGGWSIG
ncbi:hypothetical protein QQP08_025656 [Theobroma cacao]|nr:hypothetical protein QQP08_025656 [Theobroma cacao]